MKNALFLLFFILTYIEAQERIVSLSPSITEILYALGRGDALVATSSYSLYPQEAKKLPIIGGYTSPNIEKILSHRPTVVIGQSFNANTLEKLHHFQIKTYRVQLKTLQDIQNTIKKLGDIFHKEAVAKALIKDITDALTQTPKTQTPHSVMIVYGLKEDLRSGIYIAGEGIFFDDIIRASGNTNAYRDSSTAQPVLGYENVIALNPDSIIILHSHATEPNVDVANALKSWYALPTNASKNRHITVIDEDYLHIPSHRVALTIKKLMEAMDD